MCTHCLLSSTLIFLKINYCLNENPVKNVITNEPELKFRALANQYNDTKEPGPWLVHCSAGVGRTGKFFHVQLLIQK